MVKNAITLKSVFVTLLMSIRIAHIFVIDKISNYGKSVISRIFWWGIKILFRCLCLPSSSKPSQEHERTKRRHVSTVKKKQSYKRRYSRSSWYISGPWGSCQSRKNNKKDHPAQSGEPVRSENRSSLVFQRNNSDRWHAYWGEKTWRRENNTCGGDFESQVSSLSRLPSYVVFSIDWNYQTLP